MSTYISPFHAKRTAGVDPFDNAIAVAPIEKRFNRIKDYDCLPFESIRYSPDEASIESIRPDRLGIPSNVVASAVKILDGWGDCNTDPTGQDDEPLFDRIVIQNGCSFQNTTQ